MLSFLKLIRYKNLIMVLLTMVLTKYALITSFTKEANLSSLEFLILSISVISITAGGYIINDLFDITADKINKPNKIFIEKSISKKKAKNSYLILTFVGLILGVYLSIINLNNTTLLLYFITVTSLYFYSKYLKKTVLLGNLMISILIVLPIFMVVSLNNSSITDFINDSYMELNNIIFLYLIFAFFTTLIREIIKDIEDVDGDVKIKAKTLPILFGRNRATKVAFFFSGILLIFLLLILQYLKTDMLFLVYGIVFILLPLLYFMYKLWVSESKKNYSKLSNLMKVIMFFGILSMLLFKF